jgi:hypothetical protein
MATLLKLNRLSFCIALATTLTGCSVYNEFYVVNKSGETTTVVIHLRMPLEQLQRSNRFLKLIYADTVLKVSDKTKDALTKKLEYSLISQNRISIEIPPKTTVLIGGATNGLIYADSIKFSTNTSENTYTMESLSKHVSRSGGLFPPYQYTYTIENQSAANIGFQQYRQQNTISTKE